MLYLPLKYVRPGMILAREIFDNLGTLPLLMPGQPLTKSFITRLEDCAFAGVYVENGMSEGVEAQEILEPEFKRTTLIQTKEVLDAFVKKRAVSSSALRSISNIAENLVMHILGKEEVLLNVIDVKDYDNYTYTHSMYVGLLSCMIGLRLGCNRSTLMDLTVAGLLHDIGKMEIPSELVNKPTKLTKEEFEIMKSHPMNAYNRLKPCCQLSHKTLQGVLSHHEWFDGTGYPTGQKGKDIPLYGRILALADVFDALTSQRPYRKAMFSGTAVEYIMCGANTHFDFDILQAFLKTVAPYPAGTLVKLSNGGIAIVLRNASNNILRPYIRMLNPEQGKEIDLANDRSFLNLTVMGLVDDNMSFPKSFLE